MRAGDGFKQPCVEALDIFTLEGCMNYRQRLTKRALSKIKINETPSPLATLKIAAIKFTEAIDCFNILEDARAATSGDKRAKSNRQTRPSSELVVNPVIAALQEEVARAQARNRVRIAKEAISSAKTKKERLRIFNALLPEEQRAYQKKLENDIKQAEEEIAKTLQEYVALEVDESKTQKDRDTAQIRHHEYIAKHAALVQEHIDLFDKTKRLSSPTRVSFPQDNEAREF
jgi:hypothetical protein